MLGLARRASTEAPDGLRRGVGSGCGLSGQAHGERLAGRHRVCPSVDDDVAKLTEIKIKRVSKYNSFEADEYLKKIEDDIEGAQKNLKQLTKFTIKHFERLRDTYGKGRERKTVIAA